MQAISAILSAARRTVGEGRVQKFGRGRRLCSALEQRSSGTGHFLSLLTEAIRPNGCPLQAESGRSSSAAVSRQGDGGFGAYGCCRRSTMHERSSKDGLHPTSVSADTMLDTLLLALRHTFAAFRAELSSRTFLARLRRCTEAVLATLIAIYASRSFGLSESGGLRSVRFR